MNNLSSSLNSLEWRKSKVLELASQGYNHPPPPTGGETLLKTMTPPPPSTQPIPTEPDRYVSCEKNMYFLALEITPVLQNIKGNLC